MALSATVTVKPALSCKITLVSGNVRSGQVVATDELVIASDNLIHVDKLKNEASGGGYENSATVTASVLDGVTWATVKSGISCAYIAASNGKYEGTAADTDLADLVDGHLYVVRITANAGAGKQLQEDVEVKAVRAGTR